MMLSMESSLKTMDQIRCQGQDMASSLPKLLFRVLFSKRKQQPQMKNVEKNSDNLKAELCTILAIQEVY
jgi:hypothetical protein